MSAPAMPPLPPGNLPPTKYPAYPQNPPNGPGSYGHPGGGGPPSQMPQNSQQPMGFGQPAPPHAMNGSMGPPAPGPQQQPQMQNFNMGQPQQFPPGPQVANGPQGPPQQQQQQQQQQPGPPGHLQQPPLPTSGGPQQQFRPPGPGQPGGPPSMNPGVPQGQNVPYTQHPPAQGGAAPRYPMYPQQPPVGLTNGQSAPPASGGPPSFHQQQPMKPPGMPGAQPPMPPGPGGYSQHPPPNGSVGMTGQPRLNQPPHLPPTPNGPGHLPGQPPLGFNQQPQYGPPQPGQYPVTQQPPYRPQGPPQPGMAPPGQPNYPQQQQPYGGQPQPGMGAQPAYPQPQSQKRLDPDQMPSAIAVMQEDQQNRAGVFATNAKGLLPPLVTSKFQVDDQGNASPRFVRSTMYSVPALPDMLKQTALPFALITSPFASPEKDEQPISTVDLGTIGPVRCIRCKAYMSPLMQFIDGGRRFQCLLCKATTEVPPEYFQHLDHTGQRLDKWERPELMRGTYEFAATVEYCRNNVMPKEPAFIFVIDVSYNNIKSGLVNLLCYNLKSLIEMLPSHTPVGFVTYNSKVHFYNIDPNLAQPQMITVPDVGDMFMPLLTGFLVPRAEAASSIEALMEKIPQMFADTKETDAVLGPAIVAGMEALKASERVGKLLLFHSSLPVSDIAPGKLKTREGDRKLLGTDKEKTVLTPQTTYYNNLGQDCVGAGVSVDLYLFNNSYIDVATIGQVARMTGGSVNKYTYFQADIDGQRLVGELQLHLSRPVGFDAVMRVRTSTGVRPVEFYGHYYMSNSTDVELAAVDSHKSIAVEIKHDDKLTDEDGVYIQIALLYTSIFGQRRLRIHNVALSTCTQMADLYRNCELDSIINFMAKQCISKSVETTPAALKEGVMNRCAQMLATYRKHCANPSMPGQLILPECLKLLPLYTNCFLRSDAVAGTAELTPDDRSWLMYMVMTMGVSNTVHYFYPTLIPVAGPGVSLDEIIPLRCSRDKMSDEYAFILENGVYIFLWIGAAVSSDWVQDVFGAPNLAQINTETITELPSHVNTDESLRLRALIRSLRSERHRHMRLTIVKQRDKMEMIMNKFLVEDRGAEGQSSYVDFLCHMHKEIRALLNQ